MPDVNFADDAVRIGLVDAVAVGESKLRPVFAPVHQRQQQMTSQRKLTGAS